MPCLVDSPVVPLKKPIIVSLVTFHSTGQGHNILDCRASNVTRKHVKVRSIGGVVGLAMLLDTLVRHR